MAQIWSRYGQIWSRYGQICITVNQLNLRIPPVVMVSLKLSVKNSLVGMHHCVFGRSLAKTAQEECSKLRRVLLLVLTIDVGMNEWSIG